MHVIFYPYRVVHQHLWRPLSNFISFGPSLVTDSYSIAITVFQEISSMISCGWNQSLGNTDRFQYCGVNPEEISEDDQEKPAIVLLHGSGGNQSNFIPLLEAFKEKQIGPVFSFNYAQNERQETLKTTIEKIRSYYQAKGKEQLEMILIGHSLGGITAAEYAFGKDQVPNVTVRKVITIASRLKIIEGARFRNMYEDIVPIVNQIYTNLKASEEKDKLYAISAKRDWLLPREATQVCDDQQRPLLEQGHSFIVDFCSHLSVLHAQETANTLIKIIQE